MAMEIAEEEHFTGLLGFFHHQLRVVVNWVQLGAGTDPLTVEVLADQGAPVVAHDDSVRVQHGDDLEDIRVSEELRLFVIADQIFYNALHHVGSIGLSRMHPRRQYHSFPNGYRLGYACEIGDDEHVDVVAGKTLAEDSFSDFVLVLESAGLGDEAAEVGVGVRVAVREVDCVHVVLGCVLKSETVVHSTIAVICRLLSGASGIINLVWIKILVPSKLG